MVFEKDEIRDGEGFVISSGDVIKWFETKVTAGANSKGEVRLKYKGAIEVKSNGDFRFTKKPEFYGESALTGKDYDGKDYDWKENIGLVEGISWEHGDARRTKWRGQFPIPNADFTKWCNLYIDAGTKGWKDSDLIKIDFLCIRPCLEYNYNGKTYNYQWENFCYDTPYLGDEALLWTTIDINNPTDVTKIQGTWTHSENEEGDYHLDDNLYIPMKGKSTETVNIIDSTTLKATLTDVLNKKDGTAFTDEEQAYWNFGDHDYSRDDDEIYTRKVTISDDKKTITEIYYRETKPSEFFKDCELKLSKDGSELWCSEWSNKEEEYYTYNYKKQ